MAPLTIFVACCHMVRKYRLLRYKEEMIIILLRIKDPGIGNGRATRQAQCDALARTFLRNLIAAGQMCIDGRLLLDIYAKHWDVQECASLLQKEYYAVRKDDAGKLCGPSAKFYLYEALIKAPELRFNRRPRKSRGKPRDILSLRHFAQPTRLRDLRICLLLSLLKQWPSLAAHLRESLQYSWMCKTKRGLLIYLYTDGRAQFRIRHMGLIWSVSHKLATLRWLRRPWYLRMQLNRDLKLIWDVLVVVVKTFNVLVDGGSFRWRSGWNCPQWMIKLGSYMLEFFQLVVVLQVHLSCSAEWRYFLVSHDRLAKCPA